MTTLAPLAQALREVRHGRVALADGRLHTAIMCLDTAREWLWRGYMVVTQRAVPSTLHQRSRLRTVQRAVDSFSAAVSIAQGMAERRQLAGALLANERTGS